MHNKRILETRAMAKSLAEQRADALKEMQSILDTAKTENRALKEDETKRLEELHKLIDDIDKTMAAEKRALETLNAAAEATKEEESADEGTDTAPSQEQ